MKILFLCSDWILRCNEATSPVWRELPIDNYSAQAGFKPYTSLMEGHIFKNALTATYLLVPFTFPELTAEDSWWHLPSFVNHFKETSCFRLCQFEQKPFIKNQQNRLSVFLEHAGQGTRISGYLRIQQQIRKADILHSVIVFACFHTETTYHIGFTASGNPGNKDVAVFCDVFTDCQTAYQCLIQFPSDRLFNGCNTVVRLFQFYLTNQPFQVVVFTIYIFQSTSMPRRPSYGTPFIVESFIGTRKASTMNDRRI